MSRCNFLRNISTTGIYIQRTPLSYIDEQMTMKELQRKDKLVPNRQNDGLWVKMQIPDTEIGQGQNFNEYELIQNEYLKILGTNKNIQ